MSSEQNNPIGFLQEMCLKYNTRFPEYEEQSAGPAHCKKFTAKCRFEGYEANGISSVKKQAKSQSAKAMIAILSENHYFDQFSRSDRPNNNVAEGEAGLRNNSTVSLSKNPISAVNEFCQKNSIPLPKFTLISNEGTFVCECKLNDKKTYGNGLKKKAAKTEAAVKMCVEFNINFGVESQTQPGNIRLVENNVLTVTALQRDLAPRSANSGNTSTCTLLEDYKLDLSDDEEKTNEESSPEPAERSNLG